MITLGSRAQMKSDAASHPDADSRARLHSIVTVAGWLFECEESGDLNVGRFVIDGNPVILQLDATDEGANPGESDAVPPVPATPAKRTYTIHDGASLWWWDVAAEKFERESSGIGGGVTSTQLRDAARIDGSLVEALNEVEKARAWIESRL